MAYKIEITKEALQELKDIAIYWRREIGDKIDHELVHEPARVTRNRKPLPGLIAAV